MGLPASSGLLCLQEFISIPRRVKARRRLRRVSVISFGQGLKDQGTIAGGMIPKVDCCVQAIEEGVTSVHIIDGRQPHSMLYEAFSTEGTGTTVGTAQPSVGIKWNK